LIVVFHYQNADKLFSINYFSQSKIFGEAIQAWALHLQITARCRPVHCCLECSIVMRIGGSILHPRRSIYMYCIYYLCFSLLDGFLNIGQQCHVAFIHLLFPLKWGVKVVYIYICESGIYIYIYIYICERLYTRTH